MGKQKEAEEAEEFLEATDHGKLGIQAGRLDDFVVGSPSRYRKLAYRVSL